MRGLMPCCACVQVDSLYIATPQFMRRSHMDSIAAFQGLKVLHMDRQTMTVGAMDSAAFSRIGALTQLEELLLAMQLTEVDDEGFLLGLAPLHRLRRLECFGVERVWHSHSLSAKVWALGCISVLLLIWRDACGAWNLEQNQGLSGSCVLCKCQTPSLRRSGSSCRIWAA